MKPVALRGFLRRYDRIEGLWVYCRIEQGQAWNPNTYRYEPAEEES